MKKVLSLFNGIGCIGMALEQLEVDFQLYSSEVDKFANQATNLFFPTTVQLGDVRAVRDAICQRQAKYPQLAKEVAAIKRQLEGVEFDLVVAGSPCQGFSLSGKLLELEDERSSLIEDFFNILTALQESYPGIPFLLENVRMRTPIKEYISKRLGVWPIMIDSNLVSAQNRRRYYWTNIGILWQERLFDPLVNKTSLPKDKGILLEDVLVSDPPSTFTLTATGVKYIQRKAAKKKFCDIDPVKARCITASYSNRANGTFISHDGGLRQLTGLECCRLQTIPEKYSQLLIRNFSKTRLYILLGNAWTVEVITHLLKELDWAIEDKSH